MGLDWADISRRASELLSELSSEVERLERSPAADRIAWRYAYRHAIAAESQALSLAAITDTQCRIETERN